MKKQANFLIAFSMIMLNACTAISQQIIDSCRMDDLNLTLIRSKNDSISLVVSNKDHDFHIQGKFLVSNPGSFVKQKGKPQHYSYPEIGVDYIFIIIGDIIAEKEIKGSGKVCGSKIQGVMIKGHKVILTNRTLSGNITCEHYKLDETVFWDLAHYP